MAAASIPIAAHCSVDLKPVSPLHPDHRQGSIPDRPRPSIRGFVQSGFCACNPAFLYCPVDCALTAGSRRTLNHFLIVTEGSSDAKIIQHAFNLLKPHIADFFDFVDMEEGYPFSASPPACCAARLLHSCRCDPCFVISSSRCAAARPACWCAVARRRHCMGRVCAVGYVAQSVNLP